MGARQRVQSTDMTVAVEVLKNAPLLMAPEDQTQRKAFESLMPYLYVLRNKGFSWNQLTDLLTQCGFRLQPSTVRSYYSEMLATRLDICQARMNEQLQVFEQIRTQTKGSDLSAITGRVSEFMTRQKSLAAPRVDAIFGRPGRRLEDEPPPPSRTTAPPKPRQVQTVASTPPPPQSHGLVDTPPPRKRTTLALNPGQEERPPIPSSGKRESKLPTQAAQPSHPPPTNRPQDGPANFVCTKLQEGVPELPKRGEVSPVVYEPGNMEHPAIPGLILTLEERLYAAALEYTDTESGEILMETLDQKRFRVTWRKRVEPTATRTGDAFMKMDASLFRKLPTVPNK